MGEGMQVVGVLAPLFGFLLVAGGIGYGGFIVLQAFRNRVLGAGGQPLDHLEELRERVADLEERIAVADDMRTDPRMLDLEERLEFAERLLASERERAVLPEPTDEAAASGQTRGK